VSVLYGLSVESARADAILRGLAEEEEGTGRKGLLLDSQRRRKGQVGRVYY